MNKKRCLYAVIAIIATFGLLAAGCFQVPDSKKQAVIRGQVVLEGEQTSEGIKVKLLEAPDSDITDDDGNFEIPNIGGGRYTLKFSKLGYDDTVPIPVVALAGRVTVVPKITLKKLTGVIFADDFEAQTLNSAWRGHEYFPLQGNPTDGQMVINGTQKGMIVGDSTWTDYSIDVDLTPLKMPTDNFPYSTPDITFRHNGEGDINFYFLSLRKDSLQLLKFMPVTHIHWQAYAGGITIQEGNTYHIKVELKGNTIGVTINGIKQFEVTDSSFSSGGAGFQSWASDGPFIFDNFVVRQL